MNINNEEIYYFLKDNPDKSITDEDGITFIWKDGKVNSLPINHYNTNKNTKRWRVELGESEDYPVLNSLNRSWEALEEEYQVINREEDVASTPLDSLNYYFDLGFYPPPEIILAILDCYRYYLEMRGKVSLEDVFFGKLERGVGNHSARKSRNWVLQTLDFTLMTNTLSKNNKNKSQYDVAEELINKFHLNDDPESLLRKYRRYSKGK